MNSQERRGGERKRISFYVQYALDGENYEPGYGTDFSLSGLSMLTRESIPVNTFVVRLVLPGQSLTYEVHRAWECPVEIEGQTWFRSGLQFGRAL